MKAKKTSRPAAPKSRVNTTVDPVLADAAMERGERIETGKAIARGGKKTGHVPGAMKDPRR